VSKNINLEDGVSADGPGSTCADVFKSPVSRGRAMAIFMGATTFGPCTGPVISGYISPVLNWRWSFWVGLIFAGVTLIPLLIVPETYAPVLLKRRAQKMRKETGNEKIRAPIELEREDWRHIVSKVLTRPMRMFVFEPIVLFSCLYLSFVYGVFYMLFQAYPVVYVQTYNFSLGQEGLAFLSIGVGAFGAIGFYLWWDSITKKARAEGKQWVKKEEMRRLPLACAGGPFFVVSCFWLGWSARESVHWMVPICSGIFFGIGYLLIFMALLNYLVDAYKIFAASAMAAASASRSFFGCVLPFAARPRY
jgi:MFS family permease